MMQYRYEIDWEDVMPLIGGLKELWENIKDDINNFIKNYELQNKTDLLVQSPLLSKDNNDGV